MSGKPNHELLPPIVQKLVELRAELAEQRKLPQNYDNNLKVQQLDEKACTSTKCGLSFFTRGGISAIPPNNIKEKP